MRYKCLVGKTTYSLAGGPVYPAASFRGATLSFNKDDKYLAAGAYYPVLFTLEKTWRMK